MNFKVTPDFHRAFKTMSTIGDMSMKELLEASFRSWLKQYGDERLGRCSGGLGPAGLSPCEVFLEIFMQAAPILLCREYESWSLYFPAT
jgi:hypothetical protein